MELEKLADWNPWWEDKGRIKELSGVARPEYSQLLKSLDSGEVTIITGVRRSGKSTLMYQMVENLLKRGTDPKQILFVNLEDNRLAGDSIDDIYTCYRQSLNPERKAYIFLDEIHRLEGWESWVRKHYDLKTGVKLVISGSCSYLLKREYSSLLTGRNLTFEVFPLSFREYLAFKGSPPNPDRIRAGTLTEGTRFAIMKSLGEYLELGGFPGVLLGQEPMKRKLLEQYFDDILYKDIVDRYNLNSQKTRDMGLFLATNFTSIASLRSMRKALGLSYDTIKDYFAYFTEAFVFFSLDCFSYSFKEQKTAAPKVYCIDNGLRNAVSFKFSKDEGRLAENAVFLELKRCGKNVYYWKGKKEVDFVIKNPDDSLEAVNMTYSNEISERETAGLLEFKKEFSKTESLTLLTKDIECTKDGIKLVPLWKWLLRNRDVL